MIHMQLYKVLPERVLHMDETFGAYMPGGDNTLDAKGTKHIYAIGIDDKKGITTNEV